MPWTSGNFSRYYGATGWQNDLASNVYILASRHDTHDQDLATGIDACLTRDNQSKPTASFLPASNNAYDLGSSSFNWRRVWGTVYSPQLRYDTTTAENAAGVTPDNFYIKPPNYTRYNTPPSASVLATIADCDAYIESADTYTIASRSKRRAKVYASATDITELQLWTSASANTGNVFIRFCESDGSTKGFFGFTGQTDDTYSMTSYEDFRLKFRTGDGTGSGFINRFHAYGSLNTASWIGIESPRSDDLGGCDLRFYEDDISTVKGYVGFASTTDNDLYVINNKTNRHLNFQTTGTGSAKFNCSIALQSGITAPSVLTGFGLLFIDNADGDLKFQFPNGVLRTIVVN